MACPYPYRVKTVIEIAMFTRCLYAIMIYKKEREMRFTIIEEVDVILVSRGVFRQVRMFSRYEDKIPYHMYIYAAYGLGFIRLYKGGATSSPYVRWDETDLSHTYSQMGRMVLC